MIHSFNNQQKSYTEFLKQYFPHQEATTCGADQQGRHELANHFHVVRAYEDGLAPIPASAVSSSVIYATKALKSKTKVTALIYPSDIYYAGVIPTMEEKQLNQLYLNS